MKNGSGVVEEWSGALYSQINLRKKPHPNPSPKEKENIHEPLRLMIFFFYHKVELYNFINYRIDAHTLCVPLLELGAIPAS